jgi:hypothetical protein
MSEPPSELIELAKVLARAAADAEHKLGIKFDIDDPEVARDLLIATFEALVFSRPAQGKSQRAADPPS